MSAMESQITGVSIVYWMVWSGRGHRKHQSSASLAFVCVCVCVCGGGGGGGGTDEFPWQRASNAENVSIWWRHLASWDVNIMFYIYKPISSTAAETPDLSQSERHET